MATTDHTDDTILDEELDDNEYNLANENDDNEDVLLAESEFDFIDKRASPSTSQSHPLSPQEPKTNSYVEQHALEAEEDILDIGIADEDIENITFQETSKTIADSVCELSAEDTAFEHQPGDNDSNNRNCRSDAETNSTTVADQYDVDESASKISHETPSNDDDDRSARDDRNASRSDDSNARKKTSTELEDDKNRSSKQHKKISLKKSTSKTYDDLPDLSKVIEKVHPLASGRSRRKVDDVPTGGGDRSRARYKRRPEYEEDRRRNDYRRSYHSRRDRYSDEDYDSDERRSPRRTRSPPYYERDADSEDYDRFETQGDDRLPCAPYGAAGYFAGDEYGHASSQQPMPPSSAAMDGSVVTGVQIAQQTYQMSGGGDYRVQSSDRVVVPRPPPHDMMPPRPFGSRPFMQQPPPGHQPPPLGQFHPRPQPPYPPSAHMQQPPSFGGPRPPNLLQHHHPPPPGRMPPRSQNQFPFMGPRPGVGPPPRGHLPPPLRPPYGPGPPNGAPPLSSSYPPGVGQQPPPPRPLMRPPPPQMHPNMHRGPPPPGGSMCVPRPPPPPPNNFAPAQPSPPVGNFNRLPLGAPPHMRPPQPVPNDFGSSFANAPPNFAPPPQNAAARMARPPPPPQQQQPPQNFRPNMPLGQRPPSWSQPAPSFGAAAAPPMQYRHPQGVDRSHDNFPLDNRQINYANAGNDNEERYYDGRDDRRIRESDGGQKRSNLSPIRSSPTKQSRYDYRLDVNKDEDEEMRLYREKVEQQKKAREQYVRQKEEERLKSQMQNFIQNNIKGILEKREQLMRKQAAVEAGSKSSSSADHDRYESSSSRNKTSSSRSEHDDYRAAERREERFGGYDDKHAGAGRREERKDYDDATTKRTVYNRDLAPPKKDGVSAAASNRSQLQYRLGGGNAPMERRPESGGPSKKMTVRRSPSAERRPESKKPVARGASPVDWRTEPVPSKKIVVRRPATTTQESGAVAQPKRVDEAEGTKKEVHKLMKVRYKDGSVEYKSIPVRSSSGNIVTTAGDGLENVDRRTSDADARLSVGTRKRAEQSDAVANSRSHPLARRAVVSSQMPTHSVTNERTDEKTLIESIRKGIRQSSKTLAERFSNLKPSFVSDNEENEYDSRDLKKFRRVVSNAN